MMVRKTIEREFSAVQKSAVFRWNNSPAASGRGVCTGGLGSLAYLHGRFLKSSKSMRMLSHTVEGRIPLRGRLWATEGYAGKQATPQQYPSPGIHRQRRYSRRRHTTVLIERTHAEHKREGGSLDRLETVIFSHYDGMESFIFLSILNLSFTVRYFRFQSHNMM